MPAAQPDPSGHPARSSSKYHFLYLGYESINPVEVGGTEDNQSHPLQDTITALGSSFSNRLIHPECLKESVSQVIGKCCGPFQGTRLGALRNILQQEDASRGNFCSRSS
ncbi:unnamed protein product [Pleuronectes platessa]|uniref:Uncharacterized protein n=1 Tax=Pleuronectes platessa TaxID=8262 RepID=A0A9N7Y300_PLEPL|nr:unnamed protein product [Pleuronectes platessa]